MTFLLTAAVRRPLQCLIMVRLTWNARLWACFSSEEARSPLQKVAARPKSEVRSWFLTIPLDTELI